MNKTKFKQNLTEILSKMIKISINRLIEELEFCFNSLLSMDAFSESVTTIVQRETVRRG